VFTDAVALPWYARPFVRKDFEHCCVYVGYEHGTMCLDPTNNNMEVHTWPCDVNQMAEYLARQGYKVVYLPLVLNRPANFLIPSMFIPSCVMLCMRITGLTLWAFTPYDYFRKLLKHGHLVTGEKDGLREETKG
jgi:hypothetical protein